jgi:hypothetical protein
MNMPPTDKTFTQSYGVATTLQSKQITPNNPRRNYLLIENTGTEIALIQFDRPTGDGTEFQLAAGAVKEWAFKVPIGSINVGAVAAGATTLVIFEGMPPVGSNS